MKRLLFVGAVLAIVFAALIGLSAVGWTKPLDPLMYRLVALVFAVTWLNEVFSRRTSQQNQDWMMIYWLAGCVGGLMALFSLVGAVIWSASPTWPIQFGEWFRYGIWLLIAGVGIFISLVDSEEQPNVRTVDEGGRV